MFLKPPCVFLLVFCLWGSSHGQGRNPADTNKARKDSVPPRPVLAPPTPPHLIREADIMWSKRIWRVLDLRERINLKLYYPENPIGYHLSLFELIKEALISGELHAYTFNPVDLDDCFRLRLTKSEIMEQLSSIDTVIDENGNTTTVRVETGSTSIRSYMMKEDWYFEKQRSSLETRILAMCPRVATINKNTGKEDENAAPTSLFWIYYPAFAPEFASMPVFNEKNNAEERTFYSIFSKRQFSSYIVQESNVYDRSMNAYVKGLDALLEGEKIHAKIAAIEHDMWQY